MLSVVKCSIYRAANCAAREAISCCTRMYPQNADNGSKLRVLNEFEELRQLGLQFSRSSQEKQLVRRLSGPERPPSQSPKQ
jgi:hypothetical protein